MVAEKYTDQIKDWLDGHLYGIVLEDFERERLENPEFAAQCAIAAILHESGRRERKKAFLQKLSDIEADTKEPFATIEEGQSVATNSASETLPFTGKIKSIEQDPIKEGFPIAQSKRRRMIPIGRSLLAKAAILVGLLVLAYQLLKPQDTFIAAQKHIGYAPIPAGGSGYASGTTFSQVDSLWQRGRFEDVLKILTEKDSLPDEYKLKRAICQVKTATNSADAQPAILDLESLRNTGYFLNEGEGYGPLYLGLAYMQAKRKADAVKILEPLARQGRGNFQALAQDLLNELK